MKVIKYTVQLLKQITIVLLVFYSMFFIGILLFTHGWMLSGFKQINLNEIKIQLIIIIGCIIFLKITYDNI